jgi:acetyl-CoA carboxylase, biotin carboxylase subunit
VPIRRILIANRGEIAARIIRTCRALHIETVLAVSEADRDSVPAAMADRTVCIGPPRSSESYLNADIIVQAALGTRVDAVHPGYGFLSERPALARLCEQHGLVFIGPTAAQLEAVSDKVRARDEAERAGIPVAAGATVATVGAAMAAASEIGMPLLVKAVGGGGGRGMKRVDRLETLPAALELAAAEAQAGFGDPRVFLERFIPSARHVEVQVFGDGAGGAVHMGERDCSVQRRYQKLLEESPAPGLSENCRRALHDAAVRFAQSLSYRGAGTVEFLVDQRRDAFFFLEMNARIQVEHPVTEAVTGLDLIGEQIAVASGAGLSFTQSEIRLQGHAMECRINAEDPANDFAPSPGVARTAIWPSGEGIRVDTHITSGSRVPPFYDSLLGKVIAHGPDRNTALELLRSAIAAVRIVGVQTNLSFHAMLLADPEFSAGGVDTGFAERLLERRQKRSEVGYG